ncbi:hypothetical protein ACFXPQ_02565 [Streptomyces lydicus]|uniref:hypothetical protein n=1 Tax=Streptomyces lydicus TaxID=47763 RepID=UPI003674AF92
MKVKGYKKGKGRCYSAGCGTSGGVTVPWGNVAARPAVKVRSQNPVHVAIVDFTA